MDHTSSYRQVGATAFQVPVFGLGTAHLGELYAPVAESDEPADVRFRNAVRAHMRVLAASQEQTKVTFQQWGYLGAENRKRVLKLRQEYENLFLQIARDGIAEGVLRPVPHLKAALLTMIGGLSTATDWYSPSKADSPEAIADALADLFLEGLLVRAPARRSAAR